ncbi:MAG TPA: hypothetical protein VFR86_17135, partial [Burkholderiaceae bacterium]|nr:hypothetical protein [Burkholderiaceae bacterium]
QQQRQWNVWEDFMREWVRRDDLYSRLEDLLRGEDPEFAAYMRKIAAEERQAMRSTERRGHG